MNSPATVADHRLHPDLAEALALGLLTAAWEREALLDVARHVVGRRPRWLMGVVDAVLRQVPHPPLDRPSVLVDVLRRVPVPAAARSVRPRAHPATPTRMLRNPWHARELHDLGDLAAMLDLTPGELAWFADRGGWSRRETREPLLHHRVTTRTSASGAVRVLEAPKPRLREAQRRVLRHVLRPVPVHDACHGFVPGRSVATSAAPHAGRAVVLHLDLESFFASVRRERVLGILLTAGYPEPVALTLAALTTTRLPVAAWKAVPRPSDPGLLAAHHRLGRRLAEPHLAQGAPTSPALANLAAHRLDVRLAALAASWGGRYTRYADDLAFSGDWGRGVPRLLAAIEVVVRDEGFRVHPRKTGVMPATGRQVLTGLVVNERPRVRRDEVDRLRATLHNCVVHGVAGQNREGAPGLAGAPHGPGGVGGAARRGARRAAPRAARRRRLGPVTAVRRGGRTSGRRPSGPA